VSDNVLFARTCPLVRDSMAPTIWAFVTMYFRLGILGLLSAILSPSSAEMPPVFQRFDTPYGDFSAWGSLGQGFVWNDSYSFYGSEDDSFGYREGSLGGQYKFLDRYSVNVQGEYRDAGESDNLGFRLSQAFVDGGFSPGEGSLLGTNLGRIEIPFALYNRTRDRVDTRPLIVLPQSIYLEGAGFRDYVLTGDGGMLYGLHQLTEKSRLESKVAIVYSSFGDVVGLEDALLVSGWADYVWNDALRLRLSLLNSEDGGTQLTYPVLSAQYMLDRWTLTSESGRLQLDTPLGSVGTDGVYGQVEYAVNRDFSVFGRYDYLKFDLDVPVPLDIPDDRLQGQSLAFGLAYDITKHVRVDAEYHLTDGKAFLNGAENPAINDGPSDWGMLMGMVSVRF
jgi:hypothetical protein